MNNSKAFQCVWIEDDVKITETDLQNIIDVALTHNTMFPIFEVGPPPGNTIDIVNPALTHKILKQLRETGY